MKKVAIILNNGVEEIEAVGTIDLLRRASIQVDLFATHDLTIVGSHQINFLVSQKITALNPQNYDALIIPGGPGTKTLLDNNQVLNLVRVFFENNKLIAAICAAPQVLGKVGILQGKRITHYPGSDQFLVGAKDQTPQAVVIDHNLITGVGAGAVFDFALAIIETLIDQKTAQKVANSVIYKN